MHCQLATLAITLLIINCQSILAAEKQNCVTTKNGEVCGFEESVLGKTVVTHLGIPFAQPPVGELRFKPPQPLEKWDKSIDGTKIGKGCLQDYSMAAMSDLLKAWQPKEADTSEDCLFLDIRAPKNAAALPVMFNIHGGGFSMGSGSLTFFQGKGLTVEENVVYVTINYRLGFLGFGYLGTDQMPGNVGLLDQQMALKWVYENIASFGGDAEKITIFGESAGGASVAAHLIAPESRPYFSSAIVQSGTLFSDWATMNTEKAKENGKAMAKHVGCEMEDEAEIAECLRNVPGKKLTSNLNFGKSMDAFAVPVSPDPGFFGGDAFTQMSTMSFKDFNVMLGATSRESSLFLPFYTQFALRFDNVDEWHLEREMYLGIAKAVYGSGAASDKVDMLLAEYDKMPGTDVDRLIQLMSDYSFVCPTLQFARIMSRTNPKRTYLYQYAHVASKGVVSRGFGAYHSSDVPFTMGIPLTNEGWSEEDKTFTEQIMDYWTNLELNGSPSADWPPMTTAKEAKMRILQFGGHEVTTSHSETICKLIAEIQPAYKRSKRDEL